MLSFEPFRRLLAYRNIKIVDLIIEGGFSSTTTAKINKDEPIQFETLDRLCALMGVPVEDIVVFVDDEGNKLKNKDENYEELKLEIVKLREVISAQERENQELLNKINAAKHRREEKEQNETVKQKKYTIKNLKQIRKSSGLKQSDISDSMGITSSYVSMFERGQHYFSEKQLNIIKELLTIPDENIIEMV
ncbi:helix-turn-helix domain-containing protein [Paenibacillus sp. 2TAB26]|uniref:helix-turn-helix domain-containing protein n=1 Tax=Paenibacillus sp. 2TAB26 TaxID=3233005 RepID=UPI003F9E5FD0